MSISVARLRSAFAVLAVAVLAIVALVYLYERQRASRSLRQVPQALGIGVQQSTAGFSLCRSEQGRTVFCIKAGQAVQYRQGGHAAFKNVNIVVYGPQANRFDQIYGSDFEYDPQTGDATADGEVLIDLQAYSKGPLSPDQAPPQELKNPIHLKTSKMTFNQKTGLASTRERIEFRIPQAEGSAMGATYDAHQSVLKLLSRVQVRTGVRSPATITADHAVFSRAPRQAELYSVHVEQQEHSMEAQRVTMLFRDDDHVDRVLATGDVRATSKGAATTTVQAPLAEFYAGPQDRLRAAELTGGVAIESSGASPLHGTAGRVTLEFAGRNRLTALHALEGVKFTQPPRPSGAHSPAAQGIEVASNAVDFALRDGSVLERATTPGPGEITLTPATPGAATTVITAAAFDAHFDPRGRLQTLHGAPDARVASTVPGQTPKVSTSRELEVAFGARGAITTVTQNGDVRFDDGQRTASGDHARYNPATETVDLTGSPRAGDPTFSATAQTMHLDRRTGDLSAEGDVRTTYNNLAPEPGGALLAGSEPIHVTSKELVYRKAADAARFTGQARLWQGSSVVEAPVLDFDRRHRTVAGHSSSAQKVTAAFVETGKSGTVTPVNVTSAQLDYSDLERKARFEGGVTVRGAEATVTSGQVEVYLLPRGQKSTAGGPPGASQVDHMVATGRVLITQPGRQAQGDKLVYTASEGKFVLTGGPPSIFDAEHGQVTGDSLTFFNRDDRVLVESRGNARTVTQTRVRQ